MHATAIALGSALILISTLQISQAADTDGIPPEVLKQMDPDILAGKRPSFAEVSQGDIFGLREKPKLDADFVRLNFDVDLLSTVQREIVEKWIRSGANRILLQGSAINMYVSLLAPAKASGFGLKDQRYQFELQRHPVNTDCKEVLFYGTKYGFYSWPQGATVIAKFNDWAACGSFKVGEGDIVFYPVVTGNDSRRWMLNFWHWALGLPVPGAAETSTAGGSSMTLSEAAKYDSIALKNGDTITGVILNGSFTIKTSYAELAFERAKIEKIVYEGAGANLDAITLRVGDKISGVVKEQKVQIKLVAGQTSEIDKDKIKSIQMRKVEAEQKPVQ